MLKHHRIPFWKVPIVGNYFKKRMAENIRNISLFEGVSDLIRQLSDAGIILAVVTSNSYSNVMNVLGQENLSRINYFECGVSLFSKASKLKKILRKSGVKADEAILIGDEIRDIEAAKKAGIRFGAVSWGYTNLEALKTYLPNEVFLSVSDITEKIV